MGCDGDGDVTIGNCRIWQPSSGSSAEQRNAAKFEGQIAESCAVFPLVV